RASDHLIVICSPFAVASRHVADEIAFFIALGRRSKILCLHASGSPNATDDGRPELECFPPPLRYTVITDGTIGEQKLQIAERPLAAPLGDETPAEWRRASNQIVAGLLNISLGELAGIRSRRWALRLTATAIAGAAAVGLVGFGWWG